MIASERTHAIQVIAIGLALKFGSPLVWLLELAQPARRWVFLGPYLVGTAAYLWGCRKYALAKGRHALWGCTGLLCVLALPMLWLLREGAAPVTAAK